MSAFVALTVSIVLAALPFVLAASLLSSMVEVLADRASLERLFGRGRWEGILRGALAGLFLPSCECGMVPLAARLRRKGVPAEAVTAFLLAAPALNPVSLLSTWTAFGRSWPHAAVRALLTFLVAVSAAFLLSLIPGSTAAGELAEEPSACGHGDCACRSPSARPAWRRILAHTAEEFLSTMPYLILGALLAAGMKSFLPASTLLRAAASDAVAVPAFMLLAFLLSLCSDADAFVAAAFPAEIPSSGRMAFLVYGPMFDIKVLLMASAAFRRPFVLRLALAVTLVNLLVHSLLGRAVNLLLG